MDISELAQHATERNQIVTALQKRALDANLDFYFTRSVMGDDRTNLGARWVVVETDGREHHLFLFLPDAINKLIDLLMEAESKPDV